MNYSDLPIKHDQLLRCEHCRETTTHQCTTYKDIEYRLCTRCCAHTTFIPAQGQLQLVEKRVPDKAWISEESDCPHYDVTHYPQGEEQMTTSLKPDRDMEIWELAMNGEDLGEIAKIQEPPITKERVRQILFKKVTPELIERVHGLFYDDLETHKAISNTLSIPEFLVNYILTNRDREGNKVVQPKNNKVKVSVEKTEEPVWERTEKPAPTLVLTDLSLQVVIPKEKLKGVIQQWFNIMGLFSNPVTVTDLKEDDQYNLVVSLKM